MGTQQGDADRRLTPEAWLHLSLLLLWGVLIVPTVLLWKDSILWVSFMSWYAIMTTHWTLYEAAAAKREAQKSVGGPSS